MSSTRDCVVRLADDPERDSSSLEAVLKRAELDPDSEVLNLDSALAIERYFVFLAWLEGSPVGCVMATREDAAIIHTLVVVSERRGQTIAKQILQHAVEHLTRHEERRCLWTAVDPRRATARERFLNLGFEPVRKRVMGFSLLRYVSETEEERQPLDGSAV